MKISERIYRRLLRVYPRDFRDEYGEEMSLLFRCRATDGCVRLWLQVLGDLVFHAPKEHWITLKQDLRYALRTLAGAPSFAATVIATLALDPGLDRGAARHSRQHPAASRLRDPGIRVLSVNARVLGFTLVIGVGSGLLFGLAPIFQALRPSTNEALRNKGTVAGGGRADRSALLRGGLVILQIAVSLVLLVGAGLFLRTLENAYSVELGYQIDQILVASLNLEAHGYFEGG
jgi:hypothetical protein